MNKEGLRFSGRKAIKTGGNDEFDELFKKGLGAWAAKDDGKIDVQELIKALRAHDAPGMQKIYNSGDKDAYVAAFEEMFKRLFANATIYINN